MIKKILEIKKYISTKFSLFCSFFTELDHGTIVAPCIGDIIEYEDGSRTIVISVEVVNELLEVRVLGKMFKSINRKGRSKNTLSISNDCISWPPTNSKIIRDGTKIYPISQFRLSIIQVLEKILR